MTEAMAWFLGIVGTVIAGTVIWWAKMISDLPKVYMPRVEIDDKFKELERRIHNDMGDQDRRNEKQFDRLWQKMDDMHTDIKAKADK